MTDTISSWINVQEQIATWADLAGLVEKYRANRWIFRGVSDSLTPCYSERGVTHYHALVWFGGGSEARRLTAMDRWYVIGGGIARIVAYDPVVMQYVHGYVDNVVAKECNRLTPETPLFWSS